MSLPLLRLSFPASALLGGSIVGRLPALCLYWAALAASADAAPAGSVVAWGSNAYGQTNVPAAAQSGVIAISAGYGHVVALKNDGTLVAWGENSHGQTTGSPTTSAPFLAIASPVMLEGKILKGVIAIAAGESHTVALKDDGSVVMWGANQQGPVAVPVAARSGVIAIAAGAWHTLALKADGSVLAWGDNSFGQLNLPAESKATAIAAGSAHSLTLRIVGSNNFGIVGAVGGYEEFFNSHVPSFSAQPSAIGAGGGHSLVLMRDGTVAAWGNNTDGQTTGTNYSLSEVAVPVRLGGQVLSGVTAVAGGGLHTLALKSDGTVVAWGNNFEGQTTGTPTPAGPSPAIANPVIISGEILNHVTAIAGGAYFSVAILGMATPTLRILRGSGGMALSWPVSATGYTVQTKDGLGSMDWWPAPGTATEADGWNTLTVNPAGSADYFRLFKP